ncbi:src-like-adapter isoform X2 [Numenius arquata]|uniref:src-like-adapter isoform X2 n=1 Tax=Numenius arquata TaxID=31919 RepID=UPI003D304824
MGNTVKTPRPSEETNVPSQMGQESDFLAVLYDYPSADISQPIFHVGEKLRVLSDEGGWWRVHSLTTGRENYIPGKYVAKVYHGWLFEGLGREKAEELLQLPNTKVGSFMIRESETRKEVADGLCCVLTTPCLTQCTNNNSVTNQVPPVVMRNKNFNWRNIHRLEVTEDNESTLAAMDDSCLSYGLRESIASYLSLTGDDNASFASARKKKAQSLIYTGSKHKSTLHLPPTYYED